MIKKILCLVIALAFCLSGCVEVYDDEDNQNLYSREHTYLMASSDSFGSFKSDDIYVALDYLYNNEAIKSTHGEKFNITHEDVVCHKSETQTQFFSRRFKGEADYSIRIDDTYYKIKLTKEYNGKWAIISCDSSESQ